jgi:cytochrome c-type biogenesis protein CcmH/NrfG
MKKGQVIAIVVAAGIVAAVYLAQRTPKSAQTEAPVAEQVAEPAVNPLDAKVDSAVAIIQSGTGSPMAAIQLLREVVAVDSNHIGANLWLGEFSVMSGQFDRAIPRYAKILRLQPDNLDVCIKLARAYEGNGQIQQAVDVLNAFMAAYPNDKTKEQLSPVLEELSVKL